MGASYREIEMGPVGRRLPEGSVVAAGASDAGISVRFSDAAVTFLPDWLRDNCQCDQCRIRQTDERRWQPWTEETAPRAEAVGVDDEGVLHVAWTNGHASAFGPADWDKIRRTASRGAWTARMWGNGYEIERHDHHQVIADLVSRRQMFEALRRDGAVVVTGSPTEPGTVIGLLRSIGLTLRDSSLGLIFDVKLDPAGYNIAFTSEEVPPHNDNAQYTHPPSGQVLAMLVNDATGGNSVVVDGWSVLDQLNQRDPAAIDVLSRVEVGFRQYSTEADAFTRAPLVVRDRAGRFTHLRFSNQLMQPLAFDDAELADWYRAYRSLGTAIADPANQVSFRLSAGDTLFVNGYRVLHARSAYQPDGARHLQDVYFEMDDVFGHLARMSGEATNAMVTS
ncbi:MAG TPA: TauD/TfdA family dioxygenase [Ilumatobacteraceae bacterium]|nr:TauD/TfdA family dioxygenase [Ilumatobacteraceae bacterium]